MSGLKPRSAGRCVRRRRREVARLWQWERGGKEPKWGKILILRVGNPRPIGNFTESLSQAILVGIILVGRLGVRLRFEAPPPPTASPREVEQLAAALPGPAGDPAGHRRLRGGPRIIHTISLLVNVIHDILYTHYITYVISYYIIL